MCGIVGYIGKRKAEEMLYSMLKCVEYRGYDSAGVVTINNEKIEVKKTVGEVDKLKPLLDNKSKAKVGIGHTRWATHGGVTIANAHPHLSTDKNWAVVHNGIIENYMELKSQLNERKDINFISDTDTEVISQLLQADLKKDCLTTIKHVADRLKGSYALAIVNRLEDDKIFVAKRFSPLYVSKCNDGCFVASDPICFAGYCNEYYNLGDNEFACISNNDIKFYDNNLKVIDKKTEILNLKKSSTHMDSFTHFMEKEIKETEGVLRNIGTNYSDGNIFNKLGFNTLKSIENVILIGCGTAYHASLMGERLFEKYANISARTYIASEFRYASTVIPSNTLAILVSQSGETADTLGAMEVLKERGIITVALTNVEYSTLAKNCDHVFPLMAGVERAVASTKAYTAQISILYLFALYLKSIKTGSVFDDTALKGAYLNEGYGEKFFFPLIDMIKKSKDVFFLGRGFDYITVTEASLKLKEITYINCSSYPAGELKHGFLALVDSLSLSIFLCTEQRLLSKTLSSIHEVHARGGKTVLITNLDTFKISTEHVDMFIKIKSFDESLMPITSIKFFQWLAYYTSISLGINPDKPRNLAKSVTVE